ncbi:MAG: corrinoid protein [Bryobacteraceae bacterium]|nr:corrinoid protein [Bryobacteraceae bacterium]
MADLKKLYDAILNGDQKTAIAVTEAALAEKVDPQSLINEAMIPAMNEAGSKFECEEYFVPELLLAARAMKGSLALIRPLLAAAGAEPVGRVIIGTVKGDLHDIGKNLVASMLEGGGFEVIDLGADVAVDKFVAAVKERNPHLICMSALLTVTMPAMKTTIQALREAGVRENVKVMVGGAPVTAEYASEIGADGYADNASAAVRKARELVAA